MRHAHHPLLLAASLLVLTPACGSSGPDTEDDVETEGALTRSPLILRTHEARPLTFTLEVVDGQEPTTKNFRTIKVTASRSGKSFSASCHLAGGFSRGVAKFEVGCHTGIRTPNDAQNESLAFYLENTGNAYHLTDPSYRGDLKFLSAEVHVLLDGAQGFSAAPVPLTVEGTPSASPVSNPFALARRVHESLSELAGAPFFVASAGVEVPVHSLDQWTLGQDMTVFPSFKLGSGGEDYEYVKSRVSLLKRPGELSSGLATREVVRDRTKEAFPKRPL